MHLRYFRLCVLVLLCFVVFIPPCYSVIDVAVSILPQRFFVKKIAKDKVNVVVLVPPGYNPATYEPRPSQIAKVEKAKVYFAIGVPFEKVWLKRFISLNKDLLIIHTDKGINKKDGDPHIWLSPPLVKKQAEAIAGCLKKIDPLNKNFYEDNLKTFLKQIDLLDKEIAEILKTKKGRPFLVYHPCWGYFADRYGLKQIAIEEKGKEPSVLKLARLISYCKKTGIKAIFVQPQFPNRSAYIIAKELGINVISIDPLAEDWIKNLRDVAVKLENFI